jgi:hypothetical protein
MSNPKALFTRESSSDGRLAILNGVLAKPVAVSKRLQGGSALAELS